MPTASMRLNKSFKESLTKDLLKHRFEKEVLAHFDRVAEFSLKIYDDLYSSAVQAEMKLLKKGWLGKFSFTKVKIGDHIHQANFSGSILKTDYYSSLYKIYRPDRDTEVKLTPYCDYNSVNKVYDNDHAISKEYRNIRDDEHALTKKIDEARSKIEGTLASFYTMKSLKEGWPEVHPFLPRSVQNILAIVNTSGLNELLELPVDEVEVVS